MRFVVVGGYVTDCFVRTPRLPVWGSEYEVRSVWTSPGGKALNQAVALARLGAHVTAVGVVGDDGCGNEILAALGRNGIDVSGVEQRASVSTAVCICLVGERGESAILWHIDDDVAVRPSTIDAAAPAISQADAVLLTFEMPLESIRAAIGAASGSGTRVVVQPAPVLQDLDAARSLAWDRVDVVVCNEGEARVLVNGAGTGPVADCLAEALAQQLGVRTVAVTLGRLAVSSTPAGGAVLALRRWLFRWTRPAQETRSPRRSPHI